MYKNFIKPLADKLVAFMVMVVFLPVFGIVTILLYFSNGGKPFFYQQRVGRNNRLFRIQKFKTMNDRRGPDGELLPDSQRLTTIGSIVRKTSLDELPQMWNVLKGEMSLVGPRPLLVEYIPLYSKTQIRRHEVTPGITGWAQVNGRNAISWKQKFEYDVYYVDHLNFYFDFKILLLTVVKVFKSEGISADGQATIQKFTGGES